MKRKYYWLIAFMIFCYNSYSQSNPYVRKLAFQRGDNIINAGVTFGYYREDKNLYGPKAGSSVPFVISGEHGISDRIGLGFYTGLYARKFKMENKLEDPYDNSIVRNTRIVGGLRANLHFTEMLEIFFNTPLASDEIDFYLGGMATLEKDIINSSAFDPDKKIRLGLVGGARYFMLENLGIFAEGGFSNFGLLTMGLSGRF